MKKILILGGTGMLGYGVTRAFLESDTENYDITVSSQPSSHKLINENHSHFKKAKTIIYNALDKNLNKLCNIDDPSNPDYIINCIGVIKPFIDSSHYVSAYINSAFPHLLSEWSNKCGVKTIHITTDCVFSGLKGKYIEEDLHDATDFYGKSKSLGEPNDCMVLRTSIVGDELHKNASFISWVKSQEGNTVKGYTNHHWNGVTTKEYGLICKKIIDRNLYEDKLFHIFNPNPLPKIRMVELIAEKYKVNVNIEPEEAGSPCDRTLSSTLVLCSSLDIEPFEKQLEKL